MSFNNNELSRLSILMAEIVADPELAIKLIDVVKQNSGTPHFLYSLEELQKIIIENANFPKHVNIIVIANKCKGYNKYMTAIGGMLHDAIYAFGVSRDFTIITPTYTNEHDNIKEQNKADLLDWLNKTPNEK